MNFTIEFFGRKLGAIGISERFIEKVEAETEDKAILKLYEKYEHIKVITITKKVEL